MRNKLLKRAVVMLLTLTMLVTGTGAAAFADSLGEGAENSVPETAEMEQAKEAAEEAEAVKEDAPAEEDNKASEEAKDTTDAVKEIAENAKLTAKDWEAKLPASVSNDVREAMAQVAESQAGLDTALYTAFANAESLDESDAAFVMFVLEYANVLGVSKAIGDDSKGTVKNGDLSIPVGADTEEWIKALDEADFYSEITEEARPMQGDIVFVKGTAAVVAEAAEDGSFTLIGQKDAKDSEIKKYGAKSDAIDGFVSLRDLAPDQLADEAGAAATDDTAADADADTADAESAELTEEELATKKAEEEKAAEEAAKEEEAEEDAIVLTEQTLEAKLVAAPGISGKLKSITTSKKNTRITLKGKMPEDAYAKAYSVNVEIPGQNVITAYDITIYFIDENGKEVEWQPEEALSVSIKDDKIAEAADSAKADDFGVYHMKNADSAAKEVEVSKAANGTVTFEAESFSIYVVTAALENIITTTDGKTYRITVRYDDAAGIPDDAELRINEVDATEYFHQTKAALDQERIDVLSAHDISIITDHNGKITEIQPKEAVHVSIELIGKNKDESHEAASQKIVHIGDKSTDVIEPSVSMNGDDIELNFAAEGFSIYEVVDVTDSETYTFLTEDGSVYDRQVVCAGDNLAKPSVPVVENKTFIGWFVVEDGNITDTEFTAFGTKETITKEKEYILKAKYDSSVYITYFDQDGNVMRMDNADDVRLTDEDVEEGHEGDIGKVDPDRVGYSPVDKNGVSYDFLGWSETEGETGTSHKKGLIDPDAEGNVSLYPILAAGQWIYYHSGAIGSGATYTAPTFVRASQTPSAPENPKRSGYTFNGWWTAENGGTQVFDSTGALVSSAHRRLTAPLELYAHWTAQTVDYSVVYYAQKSTCEADADPVADDDYVFLKVAGTRQATAGSSVSKADLNMTDVQILNDAFTQDTSSTYLNDRIGFEVSTVNNPSVEIKGDGTSVLKVYLDRKKFNVTLSYPTYCVWKSGSYYYRTDEYSAKFPNGEDANTITALYGSKIYEYFPINVTARSKQRSTDRSYWFNSTSSTVSGAASWEDVSTPSYFAAVLSSTDEMPPQDITFEFQNVLGSSKTAFYYFELADEDPEFDASTNGPKVTANGRSVNKYVEKNGKKYKCDSERTLVHSYNFLTKGEEFYKVNGFDQAFGEPDFTVAFNGTYRTPGGDTETINKLYYDRVTSDIMLKYGSKAGDKAGQTIGEIEDIKFESTVSNDTLSEFEESLEAATPVGHEFTGWYVDEDCNVPAFGEDGNGTYQMPANNQVLYAGYKPISNSITLDPGYGQLPTGASTWFWKDYGDTFDEYTPTRNYIKSDEGTYSYVYYSYDPDDEYNLANRPRTASYIPTEEVEGLSIPQEDIGGITTVEGGFAPETNAYSFVGWFKQKADGTLESRPYNFNNQVKSDIHLVAKWQPMLVYKVKYELTDENGNELTDIGNVTAPVDSASYTGDSRAQVLDLGNSDKLPRGKQFQGWKIKGGDSTIYQPNESVPIKADYALRKEDPETNTVTREITLVPVITEETVSNQVRGNYYFMNKDRNGDWEIFYEEIVYAGEMLTSPPKTPEFERESTGEAPQFEGWYEDPLLKDRFEGFGIVNNPEPVKYLYASFEKQFHVTYHAASGDGNSDQILSVQSYSPSGQGVLNTTGIGTSYVYSSNYNLCGWTENEQLPLGTTSAAGVTVYPFNADTSGTAFQKNVTTDMDLYPVMEAGHTLSFDTLGGNPIPSQFYPTSENTVQPTDPVKGDGDQYEFKGWYKDRDYDEQFTFGSTLNESQMIYAKWEDKYAPTTAKVTVVYWIQGADGASYSTPENGKVEETTQPKATYELTAATRNNKLSDLVGTNAPYYELDKITDRNGANITQDSSGKVGVEATADNGTVINVYYKLKRFNLTFNAGDGTITPPCNDPEKVEYNASTGVYTIKNAYLGMDLSEVWPDASNITPHSGKVFSTWKMGSKSFSGNHTVSADMLGDGTASTINFTAEYVNKATPSNGDNPGELDVLNNASDPSGDYFEVIVNHHLRNTANGEDISVVQKRQVVNFTNYKKLIADVETNRANLKDATIFPNATYDHLIQQASNGNKTFADTTTTRAYTLYSYTRKYAFFSSRTNSLNITRYNYSGENDYSLESNPNKTRGVFRILHNATEISDATWVYMNTEAGGGIGAILSDTYHKSNDISATYSTIKTNYSTYLNESTQRGTTYTPGTVTVDIVYIEPADSKQHNLNLAVSTGSNGDTYSETVFTETFAAGADITSALNSQKPSEIQIKMLVPEGKNANDYEFKGWSLNSDNTLAPYAESTMPDQDLTLYAVVLPKTVSVTTLVRDFAPETRSRDKGTEFGGFDIPIPATNEDEVFVGWKDTTTNEYWDNDDQVRENIEVRAVIIKNDQAFHIYYDLNGGTPVEGQTPVAGTEAQTSGTYEDSQSGTEQAAGRWKDPTNYSPGASIPVKGIIFGSVTPPGGYEQFIYWKDSKGKTYHVNDLIDIPQDGEITLYAEYARILETRLIYQLNNGSSNTDKIVIFKDYKDPGRKPGELITNDTYPVGTEYVPSENEGEKGTYELWTWGEGDDAKTVMLMNPGSHFLGWLDSTKQGAYASEQDNSAKIAMLLQNRRNIRVTAPDLDNAGNPIPNYLIAQWEQDKLPVKVYKEVPNGNPELVMTKSNKTYGEMTTTEVKSWDPVAFKDGYKTALGTDVYDEPDGYVFRAVKVGNQDVESISYEAKADGSGYEWKYKAVGASTFEAIGDAEVSVRYTSMFNLTVTTTVDATGEYANPDEVFEVTIKLKKDDNTAFDHEDLAAFSGFEFDGDDNKTIVKKVSLGDNDPDNSPTTTVNNIPANWKYSVEETDSHGYTVKYQKGITGSALGEESASAPSNETMNNNITVQINNSRTSIVPSGIAGHMNMLTLIILAFVLATAEFYILIRRRRFNR